MSSRGRIKNGIVAPDDAFPWPEGTEVVVVPAQRKSLRSLLGLLASGEVPPTDEECDKILEEELLRKHGS